MRILVTGATGFLGGAVARRLTEQGHQVLATGRDVTRGAQLSAAGVPFRPANLEIRHQAQSLMVDCECVVHCAALSSPWGKDSTFMRANVVATCHVIDAALAVGVRRLVHISTPSIYMGAGSRFNVHEDDVLPPFINAYARTKWLAERHVVAARARGLQTIVLRPRALFGPGDTTIFPRLLRALRAGRLPVIGEGENVVDLTYIDNAVDAVVLSCVAGQAAVHSVCNVSNGEPVKLWAVVEQLSRALGIASPVRRMSRRVAMALATAAEGWAHLTHAKREPMLTRYGVSVLSDSLTLDIQRARTFLGYTPRVSIEEGLARFVASLRQAT
jgi:2-alkyl-3-oxoalkanoate reductase